MWDCHPLWLLVHGEFELGMHQAFKSRKRVCETVVASIILGLALSVSRKEEDSPTSRVDIIQVRGMPRQAQDMSKAQA